MQAAAGNCKHESLLEIVAGTRVKQEDDAGWEDVLSWFDSTDVLEARAATAETNDRGETALHIVLKNRAPKRQEQLLDVVRRFQDVDSDAFRVQDACRGALPLHYACRDGACAFDVVEELIRAHPAGLAVMNNEKFTPFGWDYNISLGRYFTQFLQHVVATDLCASGAKGSTMRMIKDRHRLLNHCKNYVPLEILKRGMLNERNLESNAMIRFLNDWPCKRSVVCGMVFELYLHIAWIITFIHATALHIENDLQLKGWEPIALLVFAALFFRKDNDRLRISTGFFQFVLLVSYLKKTFFPFSKFVSGVIKIFWSLMPFFVVSVVTLFSFSFMYFVYEKDSDPYYDPMPHQSPNPYATLIDSFKTTYTPFASGPEGNESILDFLFVVTEAWEEASEEANAAFWNYRLDLILEKTRGVDEGRCSSWASILRCMDGLDEAFINIDTVGTTTEEIKHKLSVTYREDGALALILLIVKSLGLIILGFPTLGVLWPKFFRQILFTPPKPKEDEAKVQMDVLAEEIADCKQMSKEREAGYVRLQSEVQMLSERVNAQLDIMQQLLSKGGQSEDTAKGGFE